MEIKKTSKADLEKDISLNYLMGMVIALAILFVGFEYGESVIDVATNTGIANVIDEEEIDATEQNEPEPPPPAEPEPIQTPELLNIVENTMEVEQVDIMSDEDQTTLAQTTTYVPPVEIEEEEIDPNEIFVSVEKMPEFPGGEAELLKWISAHTVYPPIAQESGIEGRVSCSFVVNADGSVEQVEVVRPVDPALDKEAIRVLKQLPKFKPGEQRGKPVRVKFNVPVRFQLQK